MALKLLAVAALWAMGMSSATAALGSALLLADKPVKPAGHDKAEYCDRGNTPISKQPAQCSTNEFLVRPLRFTWK